MKQDLEDNLKREETDDAITSKQYPSEAGWQEWAWTLSFPSIVTKYNALKTRFAGTNFSFSVNADAMSFSYQISRITNLHPIRNGMGREMN